MAIMKPFQAIRPRKELASHIAALPYDVYNREEACEQVKKEPMSFLKIDRAETQFPQDVDIYDDRVYKKARHILGDMIHAGYFIKDADPCYYIYELEMDGRTQTGLVACASIDDYQNGIIKKHENTRSDKEEDRIRHVEVCNAQTGPIFLAYRRNEKISAIIENEKKNLPIYDFVSEDGIGHRGWMIFRHTLIQEIEEEFKKIDQIYIADGHHRAASAVKVGLKRREEAKNDSPDAQYNYFLSVLFADEELKIMDYNRVIKDFNGMSVEEFKKELSKVFEIRENGKSAFRPTRKGELGLYLDDTWYALKIHPELCSDDPVDGLDVAILQDKFLAPVLGIKDPKVDQRIDFVGGIRGLEELERRVHTDCKAAFAMYPTSIEELFAVADAGKLMPPKSTWFEPKLRSGLFLHSLKE